MKRLVPAVVLCLVAVAAVASAGEVKLQLANGVVNLQARDATVREILAEWARIGQVKIVNADKIVGGPITLDLQSVPEKQALNTLLRSVSGYVAAPRTDVGPAGTSVYDRIVVMAAPRAAAATAYGQPPAQPQYPYRGGMPPGMGNPQGQMLDDQDQPVGPGPTYPGAMQRPMPGQMQQQPPSPGAGQLPTGAPGTMSPMPQNQPGQPGTVTQPTTGAPGTIQQPIRRPGGPGGPGGDGGNEL